MKTPEEAEQDRRASADRKETSFIGVGGAILIIAVAAMIGLSLYLFPGGEAEKPAPPPPAQTVPADSLQCSRLLELSRREGVAKGQPVANRLPVDRTRWQALDAKARASLLDILSCAAFDGRGLDALDEGEMVEVYDAQMRKPLARAGRTREGKPFTMEY